MTTETNANVARLSRLSRTNLGVMMNRPLSQDSFQKLANEVGTTYGRAAKDRLRALASFQNGSWMIADAMQVRLSLNNTGAVESFVATGAIKSPRKKAPKPVYTSSLTL